MYKLITILLFSLITFNSNAISLEKIAYCKEYSGVYFVDEDS